VPDQTGARTVAHTDTIAQSDLHRPSHLKLLALVLLGGGLTAALITGAWFYRRSRGYGVVPTREPEVGQSGFRPSVDPRLNATADSGVHASADAALDATADAGLDTIADAGVDGGADDGLEDFDPIPRAEAGTVRLRVTQPLTDSTALEFDTPRVTTAHMTSTPTTSDSESAAIAHPGSSMSVHMENTVELRPEAALDKTDEHPLGWFKTEDATNTTHLVLSGETSRLSPLLERRKNPADVLRQAIEREPDRSDLRLKLLELHYSAAIQHRRAFLEAVHQLATLEKPLSESEWARVMEMGRSLAPEDELFGPAQEGNPATEDTRPSKAVA
jgi:hypothetical protein